MARVETCDIVVIGGGSAAFEAAVAAREAGAPTRRHCLRRRPSPNMAANARYSGTGLSLRAYGGCGNPPLYSGVGRHAVLPRWQSRLQRR